jgi:hypothetical protein
VLGGDLLERHFGAGGQAFAVALFELLNVLLERRCFFQCVAQVETNDAQRQGQEERQAPAPFKELLLAQHGGNQHHHACAEHKACDRAEIQPAAEEAAFAVGCVLGNENRRPGVFTAHRKALGHLGQQQQDGRPDADGGVRRYQADGKGAQRHDHDGRGENLLPAELVAQGAEEQPTQRANQKRYRERRQGGDHLHTGVGVGEEHLAERVGDEAINAEVEPLHGVAQCGSGDRFAHLGVVDDGDIFQANWLDAFLARFHAHFLVTECSMASETKGHKIIQRLVNFLWLEAIFG